MYESPLSSKMDVKQPYLESNSVQAILRVFVLAKAAALARLGCLRQAENILSPLVTSRAATDDLLVLMAKIYAQQGRHEEAKQMWRRAVEYNPFQIEAKKALRAVSSIARKSKTNSNRIRYAMIALLVLIYGTIGVGLYHYLPFKQPESTVALANTIQDEESGNALGGDEEISEAEEYLYEISIMEDPAIQTETQIHETLPAEDGGDAGENRPDSIIQEILVETELPEETAVSTFKNDEALKEEVVRILQSSGILGLYSLTVDQVDGVIQIQGEVPSLPVRYQIENLVRSVTGVRVVDVGGLSIMKNYVVSSGDSLWTISQKQYGDPKYWTVIAEENDIVKGDSIRIGQILLLPSIDRSTPHQDGINSDLQP